MGRRCDREGLPSPGSGRSRWGIPPPCRCAGDRSQRHGDEKSGKKMRGPVRCALAPTPCPLLRGNSYPAFPCRQTPRRAREARPRTAIHSYWRPLRTVIEYICNRLDNIQSHGRRPTSSNPSLPNTFWANFLLLSKIFSNSLEYQPVVDPKSTCRAGKATPYIRIRTHNFTTCPLSNL